METALIALGSNLGERLEHLRAARRALEAHERVSVLGRSRVFETEPVGGPDGQGAYLNAAMRVATDLSPRALLELLLEIERSRGRERVTRWGPRTLDLDLLLFGDRVIREPGLEVPHPRLPERAFVLAPLTDLAPDAVIPGQTSSVRALLEHLDSSGVWPTDLEF